jgi:hypothetical protein
MNKRGRVTPYQVIGFLFLRVPLYRLQKMGTKALKDPTCIKLRRKTLRWNRAPFARIGSQIRSNLAHSTEWGSNSCKTVSFDASWSWGPFDRSWRPFARSLENSPECVWIRVKQWLASFLWAAGLSFDRMHHGIRPNPSFLATLKLQAPLKCSSILAISSGMTRNTCGSLGMRAFPSTLISKPRTRS